MNSNLDVTAVITDEVAAVELTGVGGDGFYDPDIKASGWAKKHPQDKANPDISFNLAMARALQDLAVLYARQAATLAGFPVQIDLDGIEIEGEPAALIHFPVDIEEKGSY